ncbi:MAG: AbrB family transcriptional regulator, partial [Gammaproteobacteria bacterium]|nr:AbrB family transcriptional regulator [Gammaproteobacteria bacterium]
MSLIALALDIDPAFVSTHHVVRIFLVVILAPLAYKALERTWMRRAPGRPPCGD